MSLDIILNFLMSGGTEMNSPLISVGKNGGKQIKGLIWA